MIYEHTARWQSRPSWRDHVFSFDLRSPDARRPAARSRNRGPFGVVDDSESSIRVALPYTFVLEPQEPDDKH